MEYFSIMAQLDDKDYRILTLLKENARLTTGEIAKELDIAQTTIHNRIKKMRESGVIKRFTVDLDRKMTGRGLVAYILCTVSYRTTRGQKINQFDIAQLIKNLPEVEDVSIVTGEIDIIVKVSLGDVDALNNFVITKLRNIDGIEKTVTSVVLAEVN
ncbi:Lrp/AsnC family transcriptional regulator [Candidatus Thorarchaeota archaeon]|nr:MAG: Lrp/AsnC family transcriptional regulator [Candidatus Thorarchaeota archaeon]